MYYIYINYIYIYSSQTDMVKCKYKTIFHEYLCITSSVQERQTIITNLKKKNETMAC